MKNDMQKEEKKDWVKKIAQAFNLSTAVLVAIVTILNFWLAYKLYPLAENIRVLSTEVKAVQQDLEKTKPYLSKVILNEQQIAVNKEAIVEIKSSLKDINNKLDRLVEHVLK